ncbi:uncharacterized protein [Malus domestica]|uniref:uncharacterized protein isoform X3 n=1 Tax=Malus domestica TaxID=3750 RepID=UPI0039755CA6
MTVDSICVGIKGFLKELKIIENGIPSEWYWVPVLNYFWLQSMLLLLMMHLFYLLVFASFFLIMERKRPIRIAPWTLFVLLWYSSKKNTSSVYTLHHCSAQKKVQKKEKSKAQPKPRRKKELVSRPSADHSNHLLTYLKVKWCRPAS